ncbi:hypothetical protein ACBJ59_24030 [Nonomuraea sp. MTCD27]|uniref:hypothetical protein n=1 Tax=Nonomuraea sp. MTCD27 TaxID=1676747 RepID=UPI0035C1D914
MDLAREIRASGIAVTLVVHEHERLGRGLALAELADNSALQASPGGSTGELQRQP